MRDGSGIGPPCSGLLDRANGYDAADGIHSRRISPPARRRKREHLIGDIDDSSRQATALTSRMPSGTAFIATMKAVKALVDVVSVPC